MRSESVLTRQYLEPLAHFHDLLDVSVYDLCMPLSKPPNWNDHLLDFEQGVPLLQSSTVMINLTPADADIASVIDDLPSKNLPAVFMEKCRALKTKLGDSLPRQLTSWLFDPEPFADVDSGLLYLVGWTVLAHYLRSVVLEFSNWQHGEKWSRKYCPICGAPPGMAQLVGVDPGRLRFMVCARCRCRWRFPRTACPFCSNDGNHRLAALAVQEDDNLRIDYCEQCDAYLKTYNGAGDEGFQLADWTSLHLDIIALDRGLRRVGASLYQLSAARHDVQFSNQSNLGG